MEHIPLPTDINTFHQQIQEVLVDEGLITERDSQCGKYYSKERGYFRYRVKCGNIHSCCMCRDKHIKKIRREVYYNTNSFHQDGGSLYLITLTIPHHRNLPFNSFHKGFTNSTHKLKDSSFWKNRMKKTIDYQFHYNRYETLINPRHGFHLHNHIVLGGWNKIDTDEVKDRLYDTWVNCSSGVGSGVPSYEQGVDIRHTCNGNYPNKPDKKIHIPSNQDTYTPQDLEKILYGYKRNSNFQHQNFTKRECKDLIDEYNKVMKEQNYIRIYNDEGRWKWSSTPELPFS